MTGPAEALLVLLAGPPGSGKSTFADRYFPAGQVVSSDALRALVCGDPNDQRATADAVAVMHLVVGARLRFRQTTVVDATNAEPEHRETLLQLARAARCPAVAVVLDVSLAEGLRRNALRTGSRRVPETFVRSTHARIQDMLAESGDRPAAGFAAAVVVRPDGTVRIAGRMPDAHRNAAWARPSDRRR